MPRLFARLALVLGLRGQPVRPAEATKIHSAETELCAGTAFLGAPSTPIAKLSAEEALRCFGVRSGA